jgi:hypothetical protein
MKFLQAIAIASLLYVILLGILFFPILTGEKDLISHDNLTFFYPAFLQSGDFWNPNLGLGYPSFAEPQNFTFSFFVRLFPKNLIGFHLLALSSVYLGSFFAFVLCYDLTKHFIGSWIGGLCFGFGGSIIGQITMLPVALTTAFLPFVVYSFYNLGKNHSSLLYWILSVLSIYFSLSFGWPMIIIHVVLLVILIYIFYFLEKSNFSFQILIQFAIAGLVGVLLAFPILFALAELLSHTLRSSKIDITSFNAYSMSLENLIQIVFPYINGGIEQNSIFPFAYRFPITSSINFHEYYRYFGIIPFILVIIGYKSILDKKLKRFLLVSLIFYILYSFGTSTPLGKLLFHIPIVNRLRGPIRHFAEINLIISILTAYAIVALQTRQLSKKWIWNCSIYSSVILLLGMFLYLILQPQVNSQIIHMNFFSFQSNNLLIFQSLLLVTSTFIIFFTQFRKEWVYLLMLVFSVDIVVMQKFTDWNFQKINFAERNKKQAISWKGRYSFYIPRSFETQHYYNTNDIEFPYFANNTNSIYQLESIDYYGPLKLEKSDFLSNLREVHPELNKLYGVKYTGGIYKGSFLNFDRNLKIGHSALADSMNIPIATQKKRFLTIPQNGVHTSQIYFYINLAFADSPIEANKEESLQVKIIGSKGEIQRNLSFPNDLGIENQDCKKMLPHKNRYHTSKISNNCSSIYKISWNLPEQFHIQKIHFSTSDNAIFQIYSISYEIREKEIFIYPYTLSEQESFSEYKNSILYEVEPYPEAYLIHSVHLLTSEEVRKSMIDFALRRENALNPFQSAFVEKTQNSSALEKFTNKTPSPIVPISILQKENDLLELQISYPEDSFLVLNHTYYPGWKAFIDGRETEIFQTNAYVRGILVPANSQKVIFVFEPTSVKIGFAVSLSTLFLILLGILFLSWKTKSTLIQMPSTME